MIFEVDDSGERKRLNITEEQFRENYEKKILDPKKVLVIVKENLRKIYIWKGKDSLVRKRFISSKIAHTLQKELIMDDYNKCNIVSMDQGDGTLVSNGDIPFNPIPPNSPSAGNAEQKVGRLIMFCEHCGMELQDPNQKFCPNCGIPLRKKAEFNDLLREMLAVNTNIQGAVIVSKQGLLICSVLTRGVNNRIVIAVSAAILDVSQGTLKELARGALKRVLIQDSDKIYILSKSGDKEISYTSAKSDTSLGIVDLDIQNDSNKIADRFEHAVEELIRGNLKRILIEGVDGITILSKAGENAILCTLTKDDASLGMVFLNIQSVSNRVSDLLEDLKN
jgi:hypothetical protein